MHRALLGGRAIALAIVVFVSLLCPHQGFAQSTGAVHGRVLRTDGVTPVPAAQISILGTRLAAATDQQGSYTIRGVAPGQHTVRAARIGYAPSTQTTVVTAGADAVVDFKLSETAFQLEQVVTTVTGVQKTAELGHAVSVLALDTVIKNAPVTSISDVLANRVPGAVINYVNGLTGTVAPIVLRGINSFSVLNNPIVIVDGARIEATSSPSLGAVGAPFAYSNASSRLGDLDMNEIESLDVVKGPAAATLYGTDAANGVLVIRTKRGQAGRTRWTAYGEDGTLVEGTELFPELYYPWGHSTTTGKVVQCPVWQIGAGTCVQDSVTQFNPIKYKPTSPIGMGRHVDYGLQASGGIGQFRYLVSGGYMGELGWMRMPEIEQPRIMSSEGLTSIPDEQLRPNLQQRMNVRANFSTDLGGKGELSLSNGLIHQYFRGSNFSNSEEAFRAGFWSSGYNDATSHGYSFGDQIGQFFQVRQGDLLNRYISSLNATYRATDWLTTRGTLGVDFSDDGLDLLQMNGQGPPGINQTGNRTIGTNDITQYSFDAGATATRSLTSSISSKTSVGGQFNRRVQVYNTETGLGLPPGSQTIVGAASITGSESHIESIVVGSYVEQEFGWKERLYVTAAVRADGASTFGQNLHTTLYPKYSLSWVASDEPALPKIPGVSSLRFRAAFGESGVQPPSTASVTQVSIVSAIYNGATVSSVVKGAVGNPNVGPERQSEAEGGLDLEILKGRIHSEWTYYSRKSTGALVQVPLASSVGGGSIYENVGSVKNAGVEGLVNARLIDGRNVAFDLSLNGSLNRSKLVKVNPEAPPGFFQNGGFVGYGNRVGYPLYGGWQKPILSYTDKNNDGIIEPTELVMGDTAVYLGPTAPTQQLSYSGTLSLWQDLLKFYALVDSKSGYVRLDYTTWVGCALIVNCPGAVFKGPETFAQQAAIQGYNAGNSNYGFFNGGAFSKLREVSVSMRLPSRALARIAASGGALTLSGRNLYTWSRWSGRDPETNASPTSNFIYTFPTPPLPHQYSARINLAY